MLPAAPRARAFSFLYGAPRHGAPRHEAPRHEAPRRKITASGRSSDQRLAAISWRGGDPEDRAPRCSLEHRGALDFAQIDAIARSRVDMCAAERRLLTVHLMSAQTSKPPVPRPTVRPPIPIRKTLPPSSPAAVVRQGYASEPPPVIRDRVPSLVELADDDLLEDADAVAALAPLADPSEALFDGMYELNYADTNWAAARLCAMALGKALGARTVIVHTHDLGSRQLRAIGVYGDGEFDLLGMSNASDDDFVASAAICNQKAVTMRFEGELPRHAPERLTMLERAPHLLVAVPAMAWGRCVAIIEIIDPDARLVSRVADSAAYVAERLAEFLSERVAA
jgi:hypothetical protein